MEQALATILVAEITGLERSNDTGGSPSLKILDYQIVLFDRFVTEHNGMLLGNAGDSLAARFTNASDAIRCAVALEDEISTTSGNQNIRIGINQGEVAVEDGQVCGNGLTLAVELQKRVDGTGICISRSVNDQIDSNDNLEIEQVGEGTDVVYRVRAKASGDNAPAAPMPVRHVWRNASFVAGLAVVLIILAAVTWQGRFTYDFEPADLTKYEFELPEKPSIAVLPFDNLSGDPSNDYLGDGLTENIIAVLASSPDLFVIARNSAFTYKGKPTKVQQVAEELGVRYVMEGSIQVQDDRMRVVSQLVDALDGKHLWAEQYDYELNDIFKLQDDLTEKILEEVEVKLTLGEQARRWRAEMRDVAPTFDDFRTFVEGRSSYLQWSLEGHRKAERLYRELYDRYPDTVSSNRLMSWLHVQKFMMQLTKTPAETLSTARHFADKAVDLSGGAQSSGTHILVGLLDLFELKHESAMEHAERAVDLSPSGASAHTLAGFIKSMSGRLDEAIELMRLSMRLEPIYPVTVAIDLGYALTKLERYGEAQAIFKELAISNASGPVRGRVLAYLAAIAVFENDISGARVYVGDLKKAVPNANLQLISKFHYTEVDKAFIERMLNALRRAGLPENPPKTDG